MNSYISSCHCHTFVFILSRVPIYPSFQFKVLSEHLSEKLNLLYQEMSSFNGSKCCQGSSRSRHSKLCQDIKRSIRRQQVSPRTSFTFLSPRVTFFLVALHSSSFCVSANAPKSFVCYQSVAVCWSWLWGAPLLSMLQRQQKLVTLSW